MSRTLISISVKSPKSFSSASAASSAFWACCSKRVKNSLFLGISDRRTLVPPSVVLPHTARRRPIGHICRPAEHVRALPPRANAPAAAGPPDRARRSELGALHRNLAARAPSRGIVPPGADKRALWHGVCSGAKGTSSPGWRRNEGHDASVRDRSDGGCGGGDDHR